MTVAQGIKKQLIIKKQTALASAASGSGGQLLRRRTSTFTAMRDTFEADEIITHQQSTGVTYGLKKTTGKIDGLLSPATYKMLFQSLLRSDFVATAAYAAGTDVTAAATSPHFVDASGGFLTAGLKVGDVGRWTGFAGGSATNNNSRNFLITALTATNMTGVFLDGSAVVADAAGDSVTFTVVGKKSMPPLTGHTNDYYTIEEFYSDVVKSETFTDSQVTQADIGLPATGNATCSFDFKGLGRTLGVAQVLTTPTSETTTPIMTAVQGAVYVNGTVVGNCTGAQLSISGSFGDPEAVLGSNNATDNQRGKVKVSGQFTGLFDSTTIQAFFDAETPVSLILVVTDQDTATSSFVTFTMGRIKITGDAPDDGEKNIVRTYPFTAEINSAGGTALAWDQTIITMQDSDA